MLSNGLCDIKYFIVSNFLKLVEFMNLSIILDIDECASNPCDSVAICEDVVNGFVCNCFPGFTGDLCQTGIKRLSLPWFSSIFKRAYKARLRVFSCNVKLILYNNILMNKCLMLYLKY